MTKRNTACRMCGSDDLTMFLDLHDQPPANRNLRANEWLTEREPRYPLRVFFCGECNLVQLVDVVAKEELYRHYPFLSSGVGDTPRHFKDYAAELQKTFLEPGDLVVEIGGNDGVLLRHFRDARVLNIEPAENVAPIAEEHGVPTLNEFFSADLARSIVRKQGKAKLILGNNSIAHIDDQHDLASGVRELLDEDGAFIIQAPYLGDIFDTLGYGQVYHEHLSYFAIRPLISFYQRFGMSIFEYALVAFQGKSLRVFIGKTATRPEGEKVSALAREELDRGWDRVETYARLAEKIEASKDRLAATLAGLKRDGKRIAAYGAAAKGMSILNFTGITHALIDFCVDGLPEKQGLYTPMSHIPIVSPEDARKEKVDYYLLLAWNFRDHIVTKEREFVERGGKFIMPIGDIEIF